MMVVRTAFRVHRAGNTAVSNTSRRRPSTHRHRRYSHAVAAPLYTSASPFVAYFYCARLPVIIDRRRSRPAAAAAAVAATDTILTGLAKADRRARTYVSLSQSPRPINHENTTRLAVFPVCRFGSIASLGRSRHSSREQPPTS